MRNRVNNKNNKQYESEEMILKNGIREYIQVKDA